MNYAEHTSFNASFVFPVTYISNEIVKADTLVTVSLLVGYFIGTLLMSPDNDLSHSKSVSNWKWIKIIWYPYAKLFRHRGISHYPALGTLSRVLYLGLFIILFIWLYEALFYFSNLSQTMVSINTIHGLYDSLRANHLNVLSFIIGIEISSILHLVADTLTSIKNFFK